MGTVSAGRDLLRVQQSLSISGCDHLVRGRGFSRGAFAEESMNAIKTLLYMGVMHGFFTYYLPWQIASHDQWLFNIGLFRWLAVPLWLTGTIVILRCSLDIIQVGRGTPSHLDPPKVLIVTGLYRNVRNPIYVGALLVQMGTILWYGSVWSILYLLFFILAFHVLIVFFEEPVLRQMFGTAYEEYHQAVPRWIPKIHSSNSQ